MEKQEHFNGSHMQISPPKKGSCEGECFGEGGLRGGGDNEDQQEQEKPAITKEREKKK